MSPARLTPAERALRQVTEKQWQKTVQDLLTAHGWKWYTAPRPGARKDYGKGGFVAVVPGWPDVFAVKGTRLLALELKTETGTVRPEQREWLDALMGAGVWTGVLRPSDRDTLLAMLRLPT